MAKEERKQLHISTDAEVAEKMARGHELGEHKRFESWCVRNQIPYIHCRTDRKSTIAVGHPDFTVLWNGRVCCIEFKAPGCKTTPEQDEKITQLLAANVPVLVTEYYCLAVEFAVKTLEIK